MREALVAWVIIVATALAQGALFSVGLGGVAARVGLDQPSVEDVHYLFLAGGTAVWAGLPAVTAAVLNAPDRRQRLWAFLAMHSLGMATFSLIYAAVMRGLIVLASLLTHAPALELGLFDLLTYETHNLVPAYVCLAAFLMAYREWRRSTRAALREADVRSAVTTAQLEALRIRLDPVRSFEALKQAAAALPADPQRCEAVIQALADRLRVTLATSRSVTATTQAGSAPPSPALLSRSAATSTNRAGRALGVLLALLLAWVLVGLAVARSMPGHEDTLFAASLGRGAGVWMAWPLVPWAVRRAGDWKRQRCRFVLLHMVGFTAFAGVWVLAAHVVRYVVELHLSLDALQLTLTEGFLVEIQRIHMVYVALAASLTAVDAARRARAARVRAAQLRSKLLQTQLSALNARLSPHFLFNALNTVASMSHEDPSRARHLIDCLAGLLEDALSSGDSAWSLAKERRYTQRYTDFVMARFEDRVRIEWSLPASLDDVSVPRLCLQSLVENAIKHNQRETGKLEVHIEGRRERSRARFRVSDSGRGFERPSGTDERTASTPQGGGGGGLQHLSQSLQLLHEGRATLRTGAAKPRGAWVEISLPVTGGMRC